MSHQAPNQKLNQALCWAQNLSEHCPGQHQTGHCCTGHQPGHSARQHHTSTDVGSAVLGTATVGTALGITASGTARLCCTRRNHTRHIHCVALGAALRRAAQGAPLHRALHRCPAPDHCPTASPCTNTWHPTPLHQLCTIPLFPPVPPQHCTFPLRVTLRQVCTLLAFTLAPCASRSLGRCMCAPRTPALQLCPLSTHGGLLLHPALSP